MPKNFQYRGRTVDELKAMSMDEFISILPARMRRSLRRGLKGDQRIVLEKLRRDQGKPIRTHARDMIILPEMIGKSIFVHTGKEFKEIKVTEKMVGHYVGEFAISINLVRHGRPGIGASRSSMYIPLK
ncbi:30S ribosomal protein S19 [Candidatus Bathyarchaeota archaeon RBG_16_57_9]|jgi:small subunit ribosomal protein S19|nr:MAG: 30S ribosomal protein S19 [Candidatus Bathyarchaeota archaeon RBG_16_57_9]OGD52588.1 MAG: 30S ribosomal protein S19 [Candidatus Bathyarchaeota archaeon RBG_13_60_20]